MPGRVHQSLLWLFRRDLSLAVELACRVAGRAPPREFAVFDRNTMLQRPGLRDDDGVVEIDLLLSVHDRQRDGGVGKFVRHVWIIEVQTVRDASRAQAWFEYLAAAARELGVASVNVEMLVVCPDACVRGWIERRLLTKMSVKPLLLEPRHVPWIEDRREARARPEAAVLSAVFHGHELRARAVVETACHAVDFVEPRSRARYRYLIQTAAHEAMELPQPIQEPNPDETPTEWEQRGLTWAQHGARFAAQGRKEAELRTRRADLLIMFELVGLEPTPQQRALVEGCEDPARLEAWVGRLQATHSLEAVFAE